MKKQVLAFGLLALGMFTASLLFTACDDSGGEGGGNDFDRGAMLQDYAVKQIIPAYTDLKTNVVSLKTAVATFTDSPSTITLAIVQSNWENAYLSWQYANAYNFGPAGEEGLKKGLIEEVGTFPVSTAKIENVVSAGSWNLSDANRDARGFLAVEYLIFNLTDDQTAIVSAFESENRKNYLIALVEDLETKIEDVSNEWSGSYIAEFVAADGTDVGSSTSHLYNEFVRSYEAIKNYKVGLPLGKLAGQAQIEPEKVEAYYSGKSVKMMKAHFTALKNIWNGNKKDGTEGIGLKEYLESVEGGAALISATELQLTAIETAFTSVPETPRFSEQLSSTPAPIETLHTELQKIPAISKVICHPF